MKRTGNRNWFPVFVVEVMNCDNAKAKGVPIGRPHTTKDDIPALFLKHYPSYKNGMLNISELARVCEVSRTTAYKYIGLLEG